MKSELEREGIKASYHIADIADIYDKNQITKAFQEIYKTYGEIDLLEFSPTASHYRSVPVLDLQAEDAFIGNIAAAIRCVNQVLPSMLKRQSGALLFTTGLSAIYPNPQMADSSIAKAGLRSYINNLQSELTEKKIFVGHISLGIFLKAGTEGLDDPNSVAKLWYEKYSRNRYGEEVYPEGVTPETVIR